MENQTRPEFQKPASRLFNISPGAGFLATLANSLVDGTLVPGFRPVDDPLLLAGATVYLPTRRAARAFSGEIIRALNGRAALLPAIRTLGDSSEDEFSFPADETIELKPAADELTRRLTLSRLVLAWTGAMSRESRALFADTDIVIPSSTADAIGMAGDLARLIDQMETEEIGWHELKDLAGPDHARWWELTTDFLKIVMEAWPAHLAEAGLTDPSTRRKEVLDLRSRKMLEAISLGKTGGPVIAAGSTGSIPATARFLKAVLSHPQGAVVLPGIDRSMPGHVWGRLARAASDEMVAMLATHPQTGLAKLLQYFGVEREAVSELGMIPAQIAERNRWLAQALLPANETASWCEAGKIGEEALAGIAVVEAQNEREEALAIAVALRLAIAEPARTAALVTPDRALAGRVASELLRFGIEVDDSGGVPLARSRVGRLALQLASVTCTRATNVQLAAFLKEALLDPETDHNDRGFGGRTARFFELCVIRDTIVLPEAGKLAEACAAARERLGSDTHLHPILRTISDADWQAIERLGSDLDAACEPLTALRAGENGKFPLPLLMAALRQCLVQLPGISANDRIRDAEGWSELTALLDSFDRLREQDDTSLMIGPAEFPDILKAVMNGHVVRSQRPAHPRIFIWGPLEARLQDVDLVVLGGLNEQTWPPATRNDPFLNRPMRGEIGLSLPERRIGQAAHDFQQLAACGNVILTRSLKTGNAPAIASRWLQRLTTLVGDDHAAAMKARGATFVRTAGLADSREREPFRELRPNPKPPVDLRPNALSITEIESWIRDPYVIHARHVLGLRPLPPLEREDDDPALRGNLYHAILADHVAGHVPGETRRQAEQRLSRQTQEAFAEAGIPPAVAATWLPRFVEIGQLFLDWEEERRDLVDKSLCEVRGETDIGLDGFSLRGRADRIDLLKDGSIAIFDYKTGTSPSLDQARTLSPQLALEGRMAELGCFELEAGREIRDLAFVRLRRAENLKIDSLAKGKDVPPLSEQMANAWLQLQALVAAYRKESQGYLSRYAPQRQNSMDGDYDHLARVREWSIGGSDDDG
ncbi:MAG: double-strand break repair protein AddB [Nitratireductor sp.]|nr:double-strand break repair protein AddB [Nitratireductor sp.]